MGGEISVSELDNLLKKQPQESSEEYGIPEGFKVKRRKYTLSEEALSARRENAKKSTGPKTPEGKDAASKNSWKHGTYAKSFFRKYSKTCKTTCEFYPCELIEDGKTQPGAECLDKEHIYEAWNAILKGVMNQEFSEFNAIAALDTAKNMQVLRELQEAVLEDGVVVLSEKIDKDGNVIGKELKPHPALLVLPKLTEILGFTPKDLMVTPKEIVKAGREEEGAKTLADLMSSVGNALKKK